MGTGSHIDAIPYSGRFDGTVGVYGALESIRALQRAGYQPRRSIELLLFTSEEPTRFGIGCLGSRLLAGTLQADADERLKDSEGRTLREVRTRAGFSGTLASVALPAGYYDSFAEFHIEQGPLLERDGLALGIVTAIAAPASLRVTIEGDGGHAGAVLMPGRRDAFLAAAELALAVESAVKATGVIDTVGTVGTCKIFPGAVNSIPSKTVLEIDVRDIDAARRDGVLRAIESAAQEIDARRKTITTIETVNADAPAASSPKIIDALVQACHEMNAPHQLMVSRAYHDTLFMSRIAPVAMLFIRCYKGYSHRPEEFASQEDMAAGAHALALALAELAR